jgi:hypothetical protein
MPVVYVHGLWMWFSCQVQGVVFVGMCCICSATTMCCICSASYLVIFGCKCSLYAIYASPCCKGVYILS